LIVVLFGLEAEEPPLYSATQGAAGASPVAALYCFASGSASSLFRMR
jgi:hypothetical protein